VAGSRAKGKDGQLGRYVDGHRKVDYIDSVTAEGLAGIERPAASRL
jgi:hypothetical protein